MKRLLAVVFLLIFSYFLLLPKALALDPVATIVEWNFEDQNQVADNGIAANLSKTISRESTYPGVYAYFSGDSGSGDYAISSTGWDGAPNTKYWQIDFTSIGYRSLVLSSKQRSSGTGPKDFVVQYSLDSGSTWLDVSSSQINLVTDAWNTTISSLSLPTVLDNQNSVYLRWLVTASASAGGGTNRIDDVAINGMAIVCGNGVVEAGETCDNGNQNGVACSPEYGGSCNYCGSDCKTIILAGPYCGDGIINGPEQCDDGNQAGGDGCNAVCQKEVVLPGSISGFVFYDRDKDGVWDGWQKQEFKLSGWRIFLDENGNGRYDRREKFDFSVGKYAFTDLAPGTYSVCEFPWPGLISSLPGHRKCQEVILKSAENKSEVNFGNYLIK